MRAGVFAAAAVTAMVMGCELSEPPDLLALDDVSPRVVSAGDRLELSGKGFPEGRPATLIFRGDLFRAGAPPVRDVRWQLPGVSHSQSLVTAEIDHAVERRFCETLESAEHTTFRGDIRVAFASRGSAPPVVGTLRGLSVDFVPSGLSAEEIREREQQGERVLAYLGMGKSDESGPEGIAIRKVTPGGVADAAGLRGGDVLLSFDDVAVRSAGDLRPTRGRRTASLEVRRGSTVSIVEVDVSPMTPRPPSDLAKAAVIVGVACLLLLLWMTPLPTVLAWIERRVQVRAERRRAAVPFSGFAARWREREVSLRLAWNFVRAAIVVALFAPLCRGKVWVSEHQDIAAIYALCSVSLIVLRLFCGGLRKGRGWSFVAGMAAAFRTLALTLPGALAIVALGMVVGSLSPADIVEAQGVLPWRWTGLQNPGLFACSLLFLAALLPQDAAGEPWPELEEGPRAAEPSLVIERLHETLERLYSTIGAGLVTLLFFGGWATPAGFDEPGMPRILLLVGPSLFFLKTGLLVVSLGALRSLVGRLPLEATTFLAYKWLLPLSLLSSLLAVFWAEGAARLDAGAIAGAALVALLLASTALIAYRQRNRGASFGAQASVNPWL